MRPNEYKGECALGGGKGCGLLGQDDHYSDIKVEFPTPTANILLGYLAEQGRWRQAEKTSGLQSMGNSSLLVGRLFD